MILCNLSNVLAEKRSNISKVSRDTHISRTTLTSLYNNNCQGIQFDTVNTLCQYFDIEPSQLFLYSKYDIRVRSDMPYLEIEKFPSVEQGEYNIFINYAGREVKCGISSTIYFHYEKNFINEVEAKFEFWEEDVNPDVVEENRVLRKVLSELNAPFKVWLRHEIENQIALDYDTMLVDGYWLTIDYPQEFK